MTKSRTPLLQDDLYDCFIIFTYYKLEESVLDKGLPDIPAGVSAGVPSIPPPFGKAATGATFEEEDRENKGAMVSQSVTAGRPSVRTA